MPRILIFWIGFNLVLKGLENDLLCHVIFSKVSLRQESFLLKRQQTVIFSRQCLQYAQLPSFDRISLYAFQIEPRSFWDYYLFIFKSDPPWQKRSFRLSSLIIFEHKHEFLFNLLFIFVVSRENWKTSCQRKHAAPSPKSKFCSRHSSTSTSMIMASLSQMSSPKPSRRLVFRSQPDR